MKKLLTILGLFALFACAQADSDTYSTTTEGAYGRSDGLFRNKSTSALHFLINGASVGNIDTSGNLTMSGTTTVGAYAVADDAYTTYGTGSDSIVGYQATGQDPDSLFIGAGTDSRQVIIAETADAATDMTIAQQTNPTLMIHSADETTAAQYVMFAHNQTNGVIDVGTGSIAMADNVFLDDDIDLLFGTSNDGILTFDHTTQAPDSMVLGLGSESRQLVIMESADIATDLTIAQQTNPTVVILSADAASATKYISIAHDQTNGVIDVGSGVVSIPDGITTAAAAALTTTSGSAALLAADADSTAFCMGAAGATDILCLDSTDTSPSIDIKGILGQVSFHNTVGTSTFVESATFTAGADMNGDILAGGGAGALTFDAASSSIVTPANSATSLLIGPAAMPGLITIDTLTGADEVNIVGTTATSTFRVDTGFATFDEQMVCTAGADMNGDILAGGGAGALTFDAASASVVYTDGSATGLLFGSADHLNLLTLISTDNQEKLTVTGETAVDAFSVAVGTADFVENVDCNAGLDVTGAVTVSTTSDLNGDIAAGGGAGALTFDAASSSIVTTDNAEAGLDMGATGMTTMIRLDTRDNAENVTFGAGVKFASSTVSALTTLDASDCGTWIFIGDTGDADTITLPSTIAGCPLRFMFTGTDHGALVDISPAAADAIHGSCTLAASVLEFNGTDDNDIGCTKATCNTGDTISLIGDGNQGWFVTTCTGIWANN